MVKKSNTAQPTCLKVGDKIIYDDKIISEKFNNFFGKIAKKFDKKTPKSKKDFSSYLKSSNINSFLLERVTEDEIDSIINKLKTR